MLRSSLGGLIGLIAFAVAAVAPGCARGDLPAVAVMDYSQVYLDARDTLLTAAVADDDVTRMQAMEAIAEVLGDSEAEVLVQGLGDKNPAVRFAAAMGIGDIRYLPVKGRLLRMAADKKFEPNRFVFCGVIYALFGLSNTDYTSQLATLIFDREKEVRSSAVLVMGAMGEPSAITILNKLYVQEQDPTIRLRVVEAMALLGEARSINLLEAYTKSQFMDERIDAICAMGRSPGSRSEFVLKKISSGSQPPYVRVAAAGALGRTGQFNADGYNLCVAAAQDPARLLTEHMGQVEVSDVQIASLQQLAARSLGWMNRPAAADVLYPLLSSRHGGVRVAASVGILKILSDYQDVARPEQLTPATQTVPARPATPPPVQLPEIEAEEPPEAPVEKPAMKPAESRWTPKPQRPKLYRAGGKD